MEANALETDKCLKDEVKGILGRGLGQSSHVEYRNMSRLRGTAFCWQLQIIFWSRIPVLYTINRGCQRLPLHQQLADLHRIWKFKHVSNVSLYLCSLCSCLLSVESWSCWCMVSAVLGTKTMVLVLLCHPQRLRQPATNSKLKHPQVYIHKIQNRQSTEKSTSQVHHVVCVCFLCSVICQCICQVGREALKPQQAKLFSVAPASTFNSPASFLPSAAAISTLTYVSYGCCWSWDVQ